MAELVFFRRGDEVLRFALEPRRVVLGRGDKSDVVIPDPEISRQHVALTWDGATKVVVEDLSGKGTIVAGAPLQRGVLEDGVDIALGQWRAIFRERAAGDSADARTVATNHTALQPTDAANAKWQPAQLRMKQGANETVHKITGDAISVGKDPTNDLVITDRFISGQHLKIVRKAGLFQLLDQRSTNGTFIGPVRIFEAEVPLGTTVRLGEIELTLEPAGAAKKDGTSLGMVGADPSVRNLIELIERVAPSSAAVAIFGESGTGKELVARAVHTRSNRADRAFIPVNCAAISKELIESELFGHEKGAFTGAQTLRKGAFEEADGGTLFLDEIGELPLDLQAKLLRALESGEIKRVGAARPQNVDVRVVAATNRDLLAEARQGKFREDLYYRLCVIPLHLPPLRSRRGDTAALAEHFIRIFAPRGQTVRMTPAAVERLQAHGWPGNIRELRNVIHRALLLRRGPVIDAADLSFDQDLGAQPAATNGAGAFSIADLPSGMTLDQMLEKVERQIVEAALRKHNDNRERVARELGVARSTLFKRLKEWGLTSED